MADRPPEAEPRQVSTPAAARPGATTVGAEITRLVVLAGSLELITAIEPDVLPIVWAQTGLAISRRARAAHIRMAVTPDRDKIEYFQLVAS
jgi:hypothetical protein